VRNQSLGQILQRVAVVIGLILVVGIVLRLLVGILTPVVPGPLMHDLAAGWAMLYQIVSPAMPPIMAVALLAAIWWVVLGRWR